MRPLLAIPGRIAPQPTTRRPSRVQAARAPVDTAAVAEPHAATSPRLAIGTPQHFRWLQGVVRAVLALNVADAVFTLLWIRGGLASEANPVLRELAHGHPFLFVAVKLALVGLASLLLWRQRHRPLAVIAIFVAFLVYYGLLLAHLGFLSLILRGAALIP
jgi:hypothetical protein